MGILLRISVSGECWEGGTSWCAEVGDAEQDMLTGSAVAEVVIVVVVVAQDRIQDRPRPRPVLWLLLC